jgi:hypothetical protein
VSPLVHFCDRNQSTERWLRGEVRPSSSARRDSYDSHVGHSPMGFDPLGALHAQGVVYLPLKLDVRNSDFVRGSRKRGHFHTQDISATIRRPLFRMRGIFQCYSRGDPRSLFREARPGFGERTDECCVSLRFGARTHLRKSMAWVTATRVGAASASAFSITKS